MPPPAWNPPDAVGQPQQTQPAHPATPPPPVPAPLAGTTNQSTQAFVFDGGAATFMGTALLGFVITVFTLGICYPFALVLLERWRAKHTYVEGRQLKFIGSARGLFGRWVLWLLLIIVTLGIYSFWVLPRLTRWKVQNRTRLPERYPDKFKFDGGAATFWGTALLGLGITLFSLGVCYPFAVVLLQRWRARHTFIDGRQLRFTGSAVELFGRWILWLLLIIVTLGIYSFWVIPQLTKWKVEHQAFEW